MLVFVFDYSTRAFVGPQRLDASDCDPRSPGTILLPGNATRERPPRCGVGLWPFWQNDRWVVLEIGKRGDASYDELYNIE